MCVRCAVTACATEEEAIQELNTSQQEFDLLLCEARLRAAPRQTWPWHCLCLQPCYVTHALLFGL